jgi:hypothetical protein
MCAGGTQSGKNSKRVHSSSTHYIEPNFDHGLLTKQGGKERTSKEQGQRHIFNTHTHISRIHQMASRPIGAPGLPGPGVPGVGAGPGANPQGAPPPTIGGIGAGPGGAAAASGARKPNLSALQEIEENYNKRLDLDISQLMESFGDIVKVASVRRSSHISDMIIAGTWSRCRPKQPLT